MADNFLSQEEVDALLQGVNDIVTPDPVRQEPDEPWPAPAESGVRPYNLANQERIVRGRMPMLEIINERFGRLLQTALLNFLHCSVEVSMGPVRVYKYSEFISELVIPANINLIHMKPLRGTGLVVFDSNLVFLLVDNLFGGDGRFHTRVEGRDFTQAEQRIIRRILGIVLETYGKSWQPVYPVQPEYIRSEINTLFANITPTNEVVVATTFTIQLGPVSGQMHFCTPYSMVEPIRTLLASNPKDETVDMDKRWIRLMTQQIQTAEVEIVAELGTSKSTLGAILDLKAGDVIPLSIAETVEATVDGVPVMACSYGKLNGQYALRVEKLIHSTDEYPQGDTHA
jgi:flagellar motor switch protein FliM